MGSFQRGFIHRIYALKRSYLTAANIWVYIIKLRILMQRCNLKYEVRIFFDKNLLFQGKTLPRLPLRIKGKEIII
jgi:hypothetical protein